MNIFRFMQGHFAGGGGKIIIGLLFVFSEETV